MAVSRNIEEQKKKLRAAVQNAQQAAEKKSSYTFTPKVGSSNSSFSELPKQELPKQTVSVEAAKTTPKKTFVPSTVMGRVSEQQTRENMFTPKSVATVKERASTPRFTSGANLPNLRASSGTVSAGTRQELSKFFNAYNAVIRANMRANQKRATIQRMIGNHSDLFRRYENETGKRFDIAAVGSEYGDINRRADQERRDRFFNKKLQDERSIIPQAGTFYGDYIRKNGDYEKISQQYAGMSGGKVDDFLKSVKPYSERPQIEYKGRNTQRYTDGLVRYYTEDGQAVDLYIDPKQAKNENLLYMTDEERSIYAALLNTRGEKTADDFLDRLGLELDQRRVARMSKNTADKANRHKVLSGAADILGSFAKGLSLPEVVKQSYEQANSDIDAYRPFNPYNSNFDALTQTRAIKEGITQDMSSFGKAVTDFTLGLGENAARIPLGPAGLYIMGAGVAAETAVNQGLKGETNASNALLTGVAYGAVEVATEKISLDSLMSIMHAPKDEAVTGIRAILKSIAKNAPRQAGYEASEEALSNIADNIADRIINGDKSEYEEYVRELMKNGASESNARKAAFVDKYIIDTLKDAGMGAASGAIFGTGGSAINGASQVYDNTTTIGQEIKNAGVEQSVVDTGMQSDAQTGARKYAERLQNKQGKGKELTDWNVGRQYLQNVKAIQSEEQFINSLSGIVQTQTHSELYDDKGNELNGQYTGGENSRVDISVSGDTSVPATAKHEFTHAFRQIAPTAYSAYENYVINAAMETNAEAVNSRLQFLKENYGYSDEVAREEIAAELTGAFNTKAAERIASGNVTLADKITSAIRTAKAQIRTAYGKGNYENSKGVQLTFEQLNNAEKLWNKALGAAANNGQMQTDGVVRNSIVEINGRNGNYGKGVYLDTNIFDGIHPRNWNKTLTQYVYDNLAGTELTVYDDNGNAETISFAKRNERATKDGANNSHRVIDKLARTKGNANILSVVHIDELLQTAKDIGNVDENSHQWLDDKGWNYRKAYVQDKNGNIYETVLNIAKARDGRNILYALSNTKKIDEGVVPSTRNSERGSLTNRQPYNNIISENNPVVKKSVKENIGNQTKTDNLRYSRKEGGFNPERITRQITREYSVDGADIDSEAIQSRIQEAYDLVHGNRNETNASRAWGIVSEVGATIARNAQNIDSTMYDTYRDMRNYIRNTPVTISEQDRADIAGTDSFGEFRRKNFGSIRIANNGTPIDIFYQELSNMYPNFFDATRETHPADQLNRIEEVLQDIRTTDRGFSEEDIDSMATDIASRIFSAIYEDADTRAPHTAEDAHNAQSPIENYLNAEYNADWDSLMNGQEAQRQEELQSRERQAEFLDGAKRGVQQRFDEIAQEDEYTDWDNLLQSEEAQRQEDRQRTEREQRERQRTEEFMQDDTLINAYNSESASRTDKKRFGKEDIVPALKKYGIGFMAREVDKLYPIKSYERFAENQIHGKEKVRFRGKNSPYVMSSNSIDAESRAKYILTEELTDFDANPIGESLADIVGDLSYDDYKDFNTYLKLRHGVEWITGDKNTDKPVWDSKTLNDPAAMKAGIRQLEEKHPDFADAAQRIYKYQADLMKAWLVDTGVITQEQYDTLRKKYPDYVPFFRQDDTPSPRFRPKRGIANQGNPIMEAEGGRQRIYDSIENIMINTSRFVNAAAKNSAMQAVVNIYDTVPGMEVYMAEAVKDPETGKFKLKESGATAAENSTEEYAEPEEYITDMVQHAIKLTDGDIVTVLQNGQKRYFKVFDADFLKAIDNLHPIQVGAVMRAVASATRIFSALATSNNPVFTLASNPIKDIQNAFVQTEMKNPFSVVTAIVGAQFEQAANTGIGKKIGQKFNSEYDGTDAYKKYMAMGGEYASAFSAGRKAMKEALNDIKPEQQGARAKGKRVVRFIPNAYGKVADAIETGPRLGEFKYSNGKAGNDVHQAHFDSKNVTLNFGRSGYVGEKINKFVPFYNPSVQGISMMIQNFKDRPLQTSLRVGTMIAISALMLALNKRNKESEEEYKSASSYLKNNYYLLHMGGGHFFKVPKSQEYGLLPSLVERAVEKYAFDNPDAFYDYTDYISTALLPSIFKAEFPFVDTGSIIGLGTYTSLLENKDFKGSPIVPDYLQDEVPAEQYDDRTSYIARWIGKALGWSPKKVDYVIKSNTGFLGKINESIFHEGEKDYSLGLGTKFTADSYFSTDKPNMFYEHKDTADRQAKSYPTADSTYLSKRFAQAQSVLGIINQIYKEDPNSEKGRQTRKAYVNYAGWNKDNPTGLTDEVFDEVKGLYNEDSSILKLPEVQREIKANGASYAFDSAQSVMNYQKDLNTAIDRAYRKQIADVGYSTMTDSEKAEILSKAKQSVIKSVKQFYIENEGKARMSFGTEDSAVKKPSAAAVRKQQEKNEYRETVQSSYMQSVADNYAKVNPGKAGEYDVDSMQIKDIKKDILKNKGYELTGDTKIKVIAAANERYYADIEKFYSGEANIEDIIGYATNGKPKYSTDNNGKRVYLTGGRYNSDGSPRFDETVEGKIMFRIQDAAQESALEEYADEIAGDTSSVADATPSPQGEGSGEPMRVSSTRFRSTRRSSGGRRSSGNSGGSRSGGTGRGVSVQAANVSESAARRRALEQLTGRSGGNPTIAKAIRGLKLEPVKALKL